MNENNKLIAEFMRNQDPDNDTYREMISYHGIIGRFHSSWDWLMPVVLKIGSTDWSSVDIHCGTGCTDSFSWCTIKWWDDDNNKFETSKELNDDEQNTLFATYKAVVEFIKWYNKINE